MASLHVLDQVHVANIKVAIAIGYRGIPNKMGVPNTALQCRLYAVEQL